MELSSLFNKKGQAIVFSEKIGFTSKFLLSEDDYVPGLRNCFVHYFELITSAEREVKVSRRSGMYQSYNFLTRLGKQSV